VDHIHRIHAVTQVAADDRAGNPKVLPGQLAKRGQHPKSASCSLRKGTQHGAVIHGYDTGHQNQALGWPGQLADRLKKKATAKAVPDQDQVG
jgi:hypothetical protein